MNCEYCNKETDGDYTSSGRNYCNGICATNHFHKKNDDLHKIIELCSEGECCHKSPPKFCTCKCHQKGLKK